MTEQTPIAGTGLAEGPAGTSGPVQVQLPSCEDVLRAGRRVKRMAWVMLFVGAAALFVAVPLAAGFFSDANLIEDAFDDIRSFKEAFRRTVAVVSAALLSLCLPLGVLTLRRVELARDAIAETAVLSTVFACAAVWTPILMLYEMARLGVAGYVIVAAAVIATAVLWMASRDFRAFLRSPAVLAWFAAAPGELDAVPAAAPLSDAEKAALARRQARRLGLAVSGAGVLTCAAASLVLSTENAFAWRMTHHLTTNEEIMLRDVLCCIQYLGGLSAILGPGVAVCIPVACRAMQGVCGAFMACIFAGWEPLVELAAEEAPYSSYGFRGAFCRAAYAAAASVLALLAMWLLFLAMRRLSRIAAGPTQTETASRSALEDAPQP